MAKKSMIARNARRQRDVARFGTKRTELKRILKSQSSTPEQRDDAMLKLQKLPRDASPTRVRNRCYMTGRPRGYYRKFGLSRNMLREAAMRGDVPGLVKASW